MARVSIENTTAPHPCGDRYVDDKGRCLQCALRCEQAENRREKSRADAAERAVEHLEVADLALREALRREHDANRVCLEVEADPATCCEIGRMLATPVSDLARAHDAAVVERVMDEAIRLYEEHVKAVRIYAPDYTATFDFAARLRTLATRAAAPRTGKA